MSELALDTEAGRRLMPTELAPNAPHVVDENVVLVEFIVAQSN